MNHTRNILLGACAAAGLGIILFAVGLRMTGAGPVLSSLSSLSSLPQLIPNELSAAAAPVEQSYPITDAFSALKVQTLSSDVELIRASDGATRVESRHGDNVTETVEVTGGVLTVRHEQKHGAASFGGTQDRVTIYLAGDAYDKLTVDTASGDVNVPDRFTFSSAAILTASGEVEFAAQCGDLSVTAVSGDVEVRRVHAQHATFSSVSGKVQLKELTVDGDLAANTVSGDVELERCDAGRLKIGTTSGEVEGTLLTPKAFSASTTSGKVDVPASVSGAGACDVRTVSGDIELRVAS